MSTQESRDVSDNRRGERIQERLDALGISDREFHETTGIDRKTLRRAVNGEERVRPSTYAAIESALADIERRMAGPVPPDRGDDVVEFFIEGERGVRSITVKGPVRDIAELKEAAARLVRELREGDDLNG